MPSLAIRIGFVAVLLFVGGVLWLAQRSASELHRFRSDDPAVWESVIAGFERDAQGSPAAAGSVVFIGASTVRFWDTIVQDMDPVPTVGRGFGGAKVGDVLHYANRLLIPEAAAIVVSIGGNDLFEMAGSRPGTVEQIGAKTERLLTHLTELAPGTPVYYVAIRPPILDAEGRDPSSHVNALIADFAREAPAVSYIDPNEGLYEANGLLRDEYRSWNKSQLSREGYRAWSAPIRDRLLRDLSSAARNEAG